jgi:hypothetical protein
LWPYDPGNCKFLDLDLNLDLTLPHDLSPHLPFDKLRAATYCCGEIAAVVSLSNHRKWNKHTLFCPFALRPSTCSGQHPYPQQHQCPANCEFGNLQAIPNPYPKMVVSPDSFAPVNIE